MVIKTHPGLMMLAVGAVLLAGCSTVTRHDVEAGKPAAKSSEVDQKLVEAHAHYAMGTMYDVDEQPELALQEYSKAALADPANEQLVLELTDRYLRRKQPEQALEILVRATAVPDASGELFAELGAVYSRLGKDQEAMAASETAVKRSPLLLAGYRNLFIIHVQKGRIAQALAVLDRAGKQPDAPADYLIDLAEYYTNLERQAPSQKDPARAGAKAALARAAKLNPTNPHQRLRLADGMNLAGDSTNAAQIYLELLNRYNDLPALREDVRAKLADIYLRGNDNAKAVEQLQAIIRDNPVNAQAYYFLGALAYQDKKLPEAEDYFHKSMLLNDDFPQVYCDLAEVQIYREHPKDALETLQKSHAKFADSFRSEFLTGLAYNAEKDFTNALNHYTSAEILARASEPRRLNEFFYFQVGATHERRGDIDEAEKSFEKALTLDPDFTEALNYLGYMLAEHGKKLDHAREMIEKAVKLEPKNAAFLDSLGWVLFKLNQPREALQQELKAVEFSEKDDATLFDHLGDIYAALKQSDKAQEAWRRSLAVERNEQVEKKLEKPAAK